MGKRKALSPMERETLKALAESCKVLRNAGFTVKQIADCGGIAKRTLHRYIVEQAAANQDHVLRIQAAAVAVLIYKNIHTLA